MDLFSISQIKKICEELELKPTKSKGQNFLINKDIVQRVINTADLNKQDIVLEIGPGFGIFTQELIKKVKKVVAVELDKKIFSFLQDRFKGVGNLELVNQDILKWLAGNNSLENYKVVANLPHQITSRILKLLLEDENPPQEMVVMMQREVAKRICAEPGKMSVLSVMVQYYSQPKMVKVVSKGFFWPRPEVDSTILRIVPLKNAEDYAERRRNKIKEEEFFKIVKVGFGSRRKMLKNNLGNIYQQNQVDKTLKELGLDLKIRAQDLSVHDWIKLTRSLSTNIQISYEFTNTN